MSNMTREQALIECRDLWAKMRDNNAISHKQKVDYLEKHQIFYIHVCPCCEYTARLYNTRYAVCKACPLLHLWQSSNKSIHPCTADDSPYAPFEYDKGRPELADEIVQECQRLLDGGLENE